MQVMRLGAGAGKVEGGRSSRQLLGGERHVVWMRTDGDEQAMSALLMLRSAGVRGNVVSDGRGQEGSFIGRASFASLTRLASQPLLSHRGSYVCFEVVAVSLKLIQVISASKGTKW